MCTIIPPVEIMRFLCDPLACARYSVRVDVLLLLMVRYFEYLVALPLLLGKKRSFLFLFLSFLLIIDPFQTLVGAFELLSQPAYSLL